MICLDSAKSKDQINLSGKELFEKQGVIMLVTIKRQSNCHLAKKKNPNNCISINCLLTFCLTNH